MTTSQICLAEDYFAVTGLGANKIKMLKFAIVNPGFRSVVLYRIQQQAQNKERARLAYLVSQFNHFLNGCEFIVGCQIGSQLIVRHPAGIVIGEGVRMGSQVVLQHGVTVGVKHVGFSPTGEYPRIGSNVVIGTNAVVIGDVEIGDSVTIGALTLVSKNVPKGATVVGIPGRIVKEKKSESATE